MKREDLPIKEESVEVVSKVFKQVCKDNNPESICVSYPTAKALHDAGIVVESLYVWYRGKTRTVWGANLSTPNWSLSYLGAYTFAESSRLSPNYEMYLAPTAEELLARLPKTIDIDIGADTYPHKNMRYGIYPCYKTDGFIVSYMMDSHHIKDIRLCEALAKMLIRLKEVGYELNKFDK